jgi:hypothetical protein
MKKIIQHFQDALITDTIKSTTKGNNLELVILSIFLDEQFQDVSLSELPFIKNNFPQYHKIPEWLEKIKFKCKDFVKTEDFGSSDAKILKMFLKENKYFMLKPTNKMHPDGIMIFQYNDKYYFMIIGDKISCDDVSSKETKKNIYSTDLQLIYIDNYIEKKKLYNADYDPSSEEQKKQIEFFNEFPAKQIGGVIRIRFEIDPQSTNLKSLYFSEKIYNIKIMITITRKNLDTFIQNKDIRTYFDSLLEYFKKRKLKEDEEQGKKNKKPKN